MNTKVRGCAWLFGFWIASACVWATDSSPRDDFRNGSAVAEIQLELDDAVMSQLRLEPRRYVPARLHADASEYSRVGVHLKGSVGSFRPLDDKPSLTLDLDRYSPRLRWRGTSKIHLNNSQEDPSYFCEWLGGEVFRAAGISAPQVAHAIVWLNGRRLGLYVLREGFTDEFVRRTSPPGEAIILEPEVGHDITGRMNVRAGRTSGMPKTSATWLEPLTKAAREPDSKKRWSRLQSVLEVDQFLTFLAVETLLSHRDGYGLARNNYRVRLDLDSGRASWLPHGMDQLFQPSDLPWRPHWAGTIARAVMETPEGSARYESIFNRLLAEQFNVSDLTNRLNQAAALLLPRLLANEAKALRQETSDLCLLIAARRAKVDEQQNAARGAVVEFIGGSATLNGWAPQDVTAAGQASEVLLLDRITALHLHAGSVTSAAWGKRVRLPLGHYRFEGRIRTRGVEPLGFGRHHGAALRVSGGQSRSVALLGDSSWQGLAVELAVDSEETVELLCELRASAGEAWFDLNSLRLRQLE